MSSPPSSPHEPQIDRDELRRRREQKLARVLATATRALEGNRDYEQAQEALDQATLLDPDDGRVLALWERMAAAGPARVDALLRDARQKTKDRSLELAAQLVDRALNVMPGSDAAVQLRDDVRKRLSAASRARTGWRLATGATVGALFVAVTALSLLRSPGPNAAVEQMLASAEEAMDAGRYQQAVALYTEALRGDPENAGAASGVSGAAAALEAERRATIEALTARARATNPSSGTVPGQLLTDADLEDLVADSQTDDTEAAVVPPAGESELTTAAAPVPLVPTSPAPSRSAPVGGTRRDAPSTAPASAPTLVVRLCDEGPTCGMLTVRVEPAAAIFFNGVTVGTGAQGVLRLPAGRHQIRLESDNYQFRRMVNIAGDVPATLEVDLEDEGLPVSP